MNPYRLFLGDQRASDVIQATPARLQDLVSSLSAAAGLDASYAPGKWTAREILCHLADTEIAFSFRLRQAAAEPNHVIQPFDQDAWAVPYRSLNPEAAVRVFTVLREWNLNFLATLPPDMLSKPVTHPERGTMVFETILETMGGHDGNHLGQLEMIRSSLRTPPDH